MNNQESRCICAERCCQLLRGPNDDLGWHKQNHQMNTDPLPSRANINQKNEGNPSLHWGAQKSWQTCQLQWDVQCSSSMLRRQGYHRHLKVTDKLKPLLQQFSWTHLSPVFSCDQGLHCGSVPPCSPSLSRGTAESWRTWLNVPRPWLHAKLDHNPLGTKHWSAVRSLHHSATQHSSFAWLLRFNHPRQFYIFSLISLTSF